MKTYYARINFQGRLIEVEVKARHNHDAKALIEHQYGRGCVQGAVLERR